ncbi:MAG: hypothetical protein HOC93_06620 [Phycisphaerae bacterium]|nr:hypothetical protein [Phycisphaerae bacterium]
MLQRLSPFVKTAWVLIILFVGALAALQTIPEGVDGAGNREDPSGLVIARMQAEFILGEGVLMGATGSMSAGAIPLDAGTVGQRQRYVAFMIAWVILKRRVRPYFECDQG